MPKNKRNVSLVISKLVSAFSLLPYNFDGQKIVSTNVSSKNDSKSLRGVLTLSSVLNFGMLVCFITLISPFFHFRSKTDGFG